MTIDLRTVFIVYVITNALCVIVMTSLLLQNRKRFPGITMWLIYFVLQFIAVLLILLRGAVPDFFSIVLANTFIVGGNVLLYIGLERFVNKQSSQIHNYVMLGFFIVLHSYFTYGYPNLQLRNINLSFGVLFVFVQALWLISRRVEPYMRTAARATGIVLAIFCLVSIVRIPINLVKWKDAATVNFFQSDIFNAIILVIYLVLFIALTFALFTLVNRRLSGNLEHELIEREQAQNSLLNSEEKYRSILENILEGYFETDLKGNIVFANDSACNLLGYDKEALYKINYRQFSTPATKKKFQEIYREIYKTGIPSKLSDYEIIRGDGAIRVNELSVSLMLDPAGKPVGFRAMARDITEKKQAEEKLRESEERISAITDSANDAIMMMDNNGNISYWNPAAEHILGYKKDEVIGLNLHELLTPERFLPAYLAAYNEFQKTGKGNAIGKTLELAARRKDGQEIDITLSLSAVNIKGAWHAVGIIQDITERKLSQELIRLRLSLFEFAATHSLEELLQKTLDEVGPLVNSPIGFYHFVEEDQKTLSLQAWSTRTLNEFCKAEGKGMHYAIDQAGVWVDCVRERKAVVHNDYNSLPHRKGLPEGHAAVIRELVVPIMRGKNIVAILGVGNKPTEYTQRDIEIVSYLADVAWEIAERKKAEEERNKYSIDLRERMKELNCLYSVSEIIRREDISQEEILKQCPDIISQAYRFPEITACRITWGDHEYKTENFRKTEWSQSFAIMVHGQQAGSIEVYCLGGKDQECYDDFFLAEERDLLRNIAELLGRSAERKQASEELSEKRQRLSSILEGTNVGTWEWNVQTGETVFNERWAEIIGYTLNELAPISIATWQKFVHPNDAKVSGELLEKHFKNELPYYECEARMRHKNGSWVWVLDRGKVATWNKDGKPLIMSGTHQDITVRKQAEEQIKYMATHDSLTDLPTLKLAEDRLAMAMGLASRHKEKAAIMFIDLDGFKKVNDTLGHDAGDFLLKTLAQRFLSSIRKTDTIARVGGDEFLLIATELKSADDAALIAKKLLKQASQPVTIERQKARVSASIGISFYPDHGEDINELIKLADEAMYRIKNSSKNGFAFANKVIK